MHDSIPDSSVITGLYALAFLLTGCPDTSIRVTVEVLSTEDDSPDQHRWDMTRLRRAVIAGAVAANEAELSLARNCFRGQREATCKAELYAKADAMPNAREVEQALLAIGLFPRNALLLTVFEGLSVQDTARCLKTDEQSICDARTDGLRALARNLAPVLSL